MIYPMLPKGRGRGEVRIVQKKSRDARKHSITLRVTDEEEKKLKNLQHAYPDHPSLPETAHRVLEMELHRDKRGIGS